MANATLSPAARQDLRHIGRFTQHRWGVEQRNRYLDLLNDTFKKLADHPTLGRPRDEIKSGLLSYFCESHTVYFRRVHENIEIVRILHQRMDAKAHL